MADGVHDHPSEKSELTTRDVESVVFLVTREGAAGTLMDENADGGGVDGGGRQVSGREKWRVETQHI